MRIPHGFPAPLFAVFLLTTTPALAQTPGNVPVFVDPTGTLGDSVITQDVDGNIGVGASPTPGARLALYKDGSYASAVHYTYSSNDNRHHSSLDLFRARGTAASPTGVFTGDYLGSIGFGGHDGAGWFERATIYSNARQDWAPGAHGQQIRFFTTANGTDSGLERVVINHDGKVGIGTSTPTASLHVIGNFVATGTKSALVETDTFGKRQLYAVESPENWFEDFGTAQLAEGRAIIRLDEVFAQAVDTSSRYHVFLTPNGDCSLYVSQKSKGSFSVRARDTDAACEFDYRIVAKRKGYAGLRLATPQ
jgi:hypothetical protein